MLRSNAKSIGKSSISNFREDKLAFDPIPVSLSPINGQIDPIGLCVWSCDKGQILVTSNFLCDVMREQSPCEIKLQGRGDSPCGIKLPRQNLNITILQ